MKIMTKQRTTSALVRIVVVILTGTWSLVVLMVTAALLYGALSSPMRSLPANLDAVLYALLGGSLSVLGAFVGYDWGRPDELDEPDPTPPMPQPTRTTIQPPVPRA